MDDKQVSSTPRTEISRRTILQGIGGATLTVLFSWQRPSRAQNSKGMIVGNGEHKYEVIHDWLVPPDNIRFGDTQGVAQDSQGRIYVGHTVNGASSSSDAIAVFDEQGRFIESWGSALKGGSHGLDLRKEGGQEFLYHCDTAHRKVIKTTLDGEVVWAKGVPTETEVYKNGGNFIPTNVAFAPNGDFYVADGYGSNWIHQYNLQGEYIRTFGGTGKEPGKVKQPHGLWVDSRSGMPELCVCDRGNNRLQYFTLDGEHLRFVTNGMRRPCHVDIRGNVMLIPDLNSVVTLLDKNNQVLAHLCDGGASNLRGKPRAEFIPGKFIHPHDAMFLRDGSILVAEWVPIGRITLLRKVS